MIWDRVTKLWNERGFEICLGLSIALILVLALYNMFRGRKGTYSRTGQYFVTPRGHSVNQKGPPRESKGETECRRSLQSIFKKPFPTKRPDFLRNPVTGGNFNLELDCYNAELGLAVEYNGIQHYKYTPYFHRSKDHFMNQKYRDDMKRRICKENRIVLIEVPYTVKIENIRKFLMDKLRIHGFVD